MDRLAAMYDMQLGKVGAPDPSMPEPTPEPEPSPAREVQAAPSSNAFADLENNVAFMDGMHVNLTDKDKQQISRIIARRVVATAKESLNAWKKRNSMREEKR
jgi:hypothetical protein